MRQRITPSRPWSRVLLGLVVLGVLGGALALALARRSPSPLPLQVLTDVPLTGGTSRFDYESLDPASQRLFIAHLGASQVTVVNLASERVVANISGLSDVHGVLVVPELEKLYVSATGAHQVVVISAQTMQEITRIPAGAYPDGMAYDPIEHALFVSDEFGQAITVIDTTTDRLLTTIPLGGEAGNIQYDPDSRRVFVAVQTRDELVSIAPTSMRIATRTSLPGCQHDHGLLLDTPQRLAFIACDGNARLVVVDLPSRHILSTQTVGETPDVLTLDSREHLLYVASESGVMSVFAEENRAARKVGEGFVADGAHVVLVDSVTHRLYLPLPDVGGRPVLRVACFHPPTATGRGPGERDCG